MVDQNTTTLGLAIDVDKGTFNRAERSLDDLERSVRDVENAFKSGERTFDNAKRDLRDLSKEFAQVENSSEILARSLRSLDDIRLNRLNDEFSRVSNNVGLAGDVQSNLGAISGLAGAAGAGTVSQGIGIAGEIVVLAEELPRLKTAVAGLPSTIAQAAKEIGASGFGLIGALTALAITIKLVTDASREQEAVIQNQIDSQISAIELQKTLTRQELEERRQSLIQQIEIAEEQRDRSSQIYDELQKAFDENFNVIERGIIRLNATLGIANPFTQDVSASATLRASAQSAQSAGEGLDELRAQLEAVDIAIRTSSNTASQLEQTENSIADTREEIARSSDTLEQQTRTQATTQQRANQAIVENVRVTRQQEKATSSNTQSVKDYVNSLGKLRVDLQNEIADINRNALLDFFEAQEQAIRDFKRDRLQLSRENDFLGLFELGEQIDNQLQDLFTDAEASRLRAIDDARLSAQQSSIQARTDIEASLPRFGLSLDTRIANLQRAGALDTSGLQSVVSAAQQAGYNTAIQAMIDVFGQVR